MSKVITVGVLRGGPSSEYDVSLESGHTVLTNLPSMYYPIDILIDKKGVWHMNGVPKEPIDILNQVDVVFNALHGEYGEDGTVQTLLERHNIPYTGSSPFACALAMNKIQAKEAFTQAGLLVSPSDSVRRGDDIEQIALRIFKTIGIPVVIKPNRAGSSVGVVIARDFTMLVKSITSLLEKFDELIIEKLITGKEVTAGVVESFRGSDIYELLPVEIIPPSSSDFFDYEAKYTGITTERCPARLSPEEKALIQWSARIAHEAVHARHYSRSDFILQPNGELIILEINTHPGLTKESLLPKPLRAIGTSIGEFLDHVIKLAMKKI